MTCLPRLEQRLIDNGTLTTLNHIRAFRHFSPRKLTGARSLTPRKNLPAKYLNEEVLIIIMQINQVGQSHSLHSWTDIKIRSSHPTKSA